MEAFERVIRDFLKPVVNRIFDTWKQSFAVVPLEDVGLAASSIVQTEILANAQAEAGQANLQIKKSEGKEDYRVSEKNKDLKDQGTKAHEQRDGQKPSSLKKPRAQIPIEQMSLETEEDTYYWLGRACKDGAQILEELPKKTKKNFYYCFSEHLEKVGEEMKK